MAERRLGDDGAGDDRVLSGADDYRTAAFFVPGKSQSAQYGDKSQSPEDGAAAAANDCEWRKTA